METPCAIHPLAEEHLNACAAIAAAAPDPWSKETLRRTLADEHRTCFAALVGHTPAGFACFLAVGDTADLEMVAVHPDYRRKGVARALLLHGFAALQKAGATRCLLELRTSNAPALALYHNLGFRQLAVRNGMYRNPSEDGLLMAANLDKLLLASS